jgi:hypothetical protein
VDDFFEIPLDFFFGGTFAPFFRASESPIAMACLRLFTVPPFPPGPDFNWPRFSLCIAFSTLLLADLLYLRPLDPLLLLDVFFVVELFFAGIVLHSRDLG